MMIDRHESQRRAQTIEARRVYIQPKNLVLAIANNHGPVTQLVVGGYHLWVLGEENSARVIQRLFDLHQLHIEPHDGDVQCKRNQKPQEEP